MDSDSNKSGNNFFSGFLFGVIVGGIVVFLLGTKKGKKILKAISEEGAGNISNILDKIDKSVDLPDEFSEDESSFEQSSPSPEPVSQQNAKPKIKRFFRGISRHAN